MYVAQLAVFWNPHKTDKRNQRVQRKITVY